MEEQKWSLTPGASCTWYRFIETISLPSFSLYLISHELFAPSLRASSASRRLSFPW